MSSLVQGDVFCRSGDAVEKKVDWSDLSDMTIWRLCHGGHPERDRFTLALDRYGATSAYLCTDVPCPWQSLNDIAIESAAIGTCLGMSFVVLGKSLYRLYKNYRRVRQQDVNAMEMRPLALRLPELGQE